MALFVVDISGVLAVQSHNEIRWCLKEEFCMNRAQIKSSNSCKNDDMGHPQYLFDEIFPAVQNIES